MLRLGQAIKYQFYHNCIMAIYRVTCNDCSKEWTYDDADPPDYANPAKNRYLSGDSIEDADWDAHSAALGKCDKHAQETGLSPSEESHTVEIVTVEG